MGQRITCTSVGGYESALTRGKQYEVAAHDEAKQQVRVHGDNNRMRWYSTGYFDFDNGLVVSLVEWRFDYPVIDELNNRDETNNYVEVIITFNDATKRWCGLMTPDYLKKLIEPRNDPAQWSGGNFPALWGNHMIYIRDLKFETVDWMLRYMDRNNELISYTRLIQPCTEEEDQEEGAE